MMMPDIGLAPDAGKGRNFELLFCDECGRPTNSTDHCPYCGCDCCCLCHKTHVEGHEGEE